MTTDSTQSEKDKARKARKRITDRKSQQHHRERQRAYIQQLEETIETYKQSCTQNGDPDIRRLIDENEKLRERCHNLESLLNRIKTLSSGIELPPPTPPSSDTAARQMPLSPDQRANAGADNGSPDSIEHATGISLGSPIIDLGMPDFHAHDLPPLGQFDTVDPTSLTCADYHQLQHSHPEMVPEDAAEDISFETNRDGEAATGTGMSSQDLELCLANITEGSGMSLDLAPRSLTTRDPLLSRLAAMQLPTGMTGPMHSLLSASRGENIWENILQRMIEEARNQHAKGLFPTRRPTLRAVLSQDTSDVLAARLYHHLCSYGPIPLHNFLAIFWVQYLFLRWQVLGTLAAFLQMPEFMRPTDLETRVPHPLCIGMLVWPDVRRTLIRDSMTLDPETVGTMLLRALDTNWNPTAHVQGELIGSTDLLAVVEEQACKIDTWKVSAEFCHRNPQFAQCRLPKRSSVG